MTTNHPTLSNARLVTFRKIEFVHGLKNKSLLNITMFKKMAYQFMEDQYHGFS
jgi:hypothetical protein